MHQKMLREYEFLFLNCKQKCGIRSFLTKKQFKFIPKYAQIDYESKKERLTFLLRCIKVSTVSSLTLNIFYFNISKKYTNNLPLHCILYHGAVAL